MTFDETIDNINNHYDYDIDKYTVIDILEELKKRIHANKYIKSKGKGKLK